MTDIQIERLAIGFTEEISIIRFPDNAIQLACHEVLGVPALTRKIDAMVESGGVRRILLDLSDVDFIDGASMGFFVRLSRNLRKAGGELMICSLGKHVEEMFRLTNLDRVFTIHPDRRSALDAFEAGR